MLDIDFRRTFFKRRKKLIFPKRPKMFQQQQQQFNNSNNSRDQEDQFPKCRLLKFRENRHQQQQHCRTRPRHRKNCRQVATTLRRQKGRMQKCRRDQ